MELHVELQLETQEGKHGCQNVQVEESGKATEREALYYEGVYLYAS